MVLNNSFHTIYIVKNKNRTIKIIVGIIFVFNLIGFFIQVFNAWPIVFSINILLTILFLTLGILLISEYKQYGIEIGMIAGYFILPRVIVFLHSIVPYTLYFQPVYVGIISVIILTRILTLEEDTSLVSKKESSITPDNQTTPASDYTKLSKEYVIVLIVYLLLFGKKQFAYVDLTGRFAFLLSSPSPDIIRFIDTILLVLLIVFILGSIVYFGLVFTAYKSTLLHKNNVISTTVLFYLFLVVSGIVGYENASTLGECYKAPLLSLLLLITTTIFLTHYNYMNIKMSHEYHTNMQYSMVINSIALSFVVYSISYNFYNLAYGSSSGIILLILTVSGLVITYGVLLGKKGPFKISGLTIIGLIISIFYYQALISHLISSTASTCT